MKHLRITIGGLTLAGLLALTACGSDSETGDDPSQSSSPSQGNQAPGFDTAQFQEIRDCLEAAGLADKFPSGIPSDMPSDMPSEFPSDMPSDMPSEFPSGMPTDMVSGGAGGIFAALQDPEVQEALEACGVELPQAPQGQ